MKKLVLLTSGLALAACGGGGGSSHSGSSASVYVAPRAAVTAAVATSNAQITNMPSEVVVASNSSAPVSVVSAESTTSNGVTYTSYRLDDVKLFMAENLDTEGHSYVNLELNEDTGEIDAVKMKVGSVESGRTVREQNTDSSFKDTFAGPIFEYVKGGTGNDKDQAVFRVVDNGALTMEDLNTLAEENSLPATGHWNRVDEKMVFNSLGATAGLQYSDFGHFNPVYKSKNTELSTDAQILGARDGSLNRVGDKDKYRDDEEFAAAQAKEDYQLFAGGYAISGTTMLDTLVPENDTTYTGKAIGRVYTSIQGDGEGRAAKIAAWNVPGGSDGHDLAKAYTTSAATMTIGTDGTQTLFMPFNTTSDTADKFYDVTITQAPSADPSFDFNDTATSMSTSPYRVNNTPVAGKTEQDFTPGYYGVNTPEEAAGTARHYTEQDLGDDFTREWEFQAAYGMKKQ